MVLMFKGADGRIEDFTFKIIAEHVGEYRQEIAEAIERVTGKYQKKVK